MALARLVNGGFFLLTAAYCLLTYNAFAYRQFVKPHLVTWLTDFVVWHHVGYWACLAITALTLRWAPGMGRGSAVGRAYLATASLVGVALAFRPILPQVENDWRGLVLALVALAFPAWVAVADHLAAPPQTRLTPSSRIRVFLAGLLAGGVVWAAQTVAAPWRADRAGDIPLTLVDLTFGVATSAVAHLVAFVTLAALVVAVLAVTRSVAGEWAEYWAMAGLAALGITWVWVRVIFSALAFTGPVAWAVGSSVAITLTAIWSAMAQLNVSCDERPTAVDRWLTPLGGAGSRSLAAVALVATPVVAAGAVIAVEPVDWDFLLQKVCVALMWAVAFGYAYLTLPDCRAGWRLLAGPPVLAALLVGGRVVAEPAFAASGSYTGFVPTFVLEGYAAVDPSFRLIEDSWRRTVPEDAAFYRVLRAHSAIQHVDVEPVSVDLVPTITPAHESKPHVFVFVVDSLRQDYLAPYNARVHFTPSIARFAAESVVFERAFTRYGGTGLSVPALWSGSMLLHKQYVTPFGPMNALLKLIDAKGYQPIVSLDSVMAPLLAPTDGERDTPSLRDVPDFIELDRDVPIVDYDLCRTLDELRQVVPRRLSGGRSAFVYTLPQNLHISRVRSKPVPPDRDYTGFVAPVAAELERIDACFGSFLDHLRREGLYDDSVIVLTADHGDSLGEWLRWGHSYTMFPEVVRIPLIVHLPPPVRDRFSWEAARVALSTDITPSLYALLGHQPLDRGPLFGRSLFQPREAASGHRAAEPATTGRSPDEPHLLASSYGAVYAVLRDNGRFVYIADGVNQREYAYDLGGATPLRIGVTPRTRAENRSFIHAQLDALARMYRFQPAP